MSRSIQSVVSDGGEPECVGGWGAGLSGRDQENDVRQLCWDRQRGMEGGGREGREEGREGREGGGGEREKGPHMHTHVYNTHTHTHTHTQVCIWRLSSAQSGLSSISGGHHSPTNNSIGQWFPSNSGCDYFHREDEASVMVI